MLLWNVGKEPSVGWKSPKDSIILQREQVMGGSCSDVVWIKWPLGSPDFLWGYTKVRVFVPSELPNLQLHCDSFDYRLNVSHATGEAHIECLRGLYKTYIYIYIYICEILVRRICFPCNFENVILFVATPSCVYLFISLNALSVHRPAKNRRAERATLDAEHAHTATQSVTWLLSVIHVAASTVTLCHPKSFTHSAFMW